MALKYYCDKCGAEISSPGNDYSASQVLFHRTLGHYDGWKVEWEIRREYDGKPTDLCKRCMLILIKQATREKLDAEKARA